jgi:uncharacterized membrane protein
MKLGERKMMETKETRKFNTTLFLTRTAIIAGLYTVLVYFLQPISFLQIQCRVAEGLRATCIIPGGCVGTLLGQFLGNLGSPLGLIDWLSPIVNIPGVIAIYYLHKKWKFPGLLLGFAIYCVGISLWVDYMLFVSFGLPLFVNFPFILIGEVIAVYGIGLAVFGVMRKIEILY